MYETTIKRSTVPSAFFIIATEGHCERAASGSLSLFPVLSHNFASSECIFLSAIVGS